MYLLLSVKVFKPPFFDQYDFETVQVIKKVLNKNSNCIDIGAHKGEILQSILRAAPAGNHFAFEPIPYLFKKLQKKFGKKISLHNMALADETGSAQFTIFKDRPAVSGLKERKFEHKNYETEKIDVRIDVLDNLIPDNLPIHLIKIDVEGAEMLALKGAEKIIKTYKPIILFEFGLGGSDLYNATPEEMYDFLTNCGLSVNKQAHFLKDKKPFNKEEFCGQYYKGYNFFFIAYP